ncbi:MAG: MarR family winged helix-turn-helix transcriptional regulator [Pleomorphochaeta sp.]
MYKELAKELVKYQFVLLRKEGSNRGNIDLLRGTKRVIGYLTEVKDGVTPTELSEFMSVSSARIASILNKLEEQEIIIRVNNKEDKRKKIVYLSEKGRQVGLSYQEKYINETVELLKALGESDAKEHVRIIKKIYFLYINNEREKVNG